MQIVNKKIHSNQWYFSHFWLLLLLFCCLIHAFIAHLSQFIPLPRMWFTGAWYCWVWNWVNCTPKNIPFSGTLLVMSFTFYQKWFFPSNSLGSRFHLIFLRFGGFKQNSPLFTPLTQIISHKSIQKDFIVQCSSVIFPKINSSAWSIGSIDNKIFSKIFNSFRKKGKKRQQFWC